MEIEQLVKTAILLPFQHFFDFVSFTEQIPTLQRLQKEDQNQITMRFTANIYMQRMIDMYGYEDMYDCEANKLKGGGGKWYVCFHTMTMQL